MNFPDALLGSARILIVDDNPVNVELLRSMLEDVGFEKIFGVTNPRLVGPLHVAEPFDLILLDIRMPGMDGHEVLEHLHRYKEKDDYVPVLVLTAENNPETRRRALAGGARDFITKPFDRNEVLARIHNVLEVRSLYTEQTRQKELFEGVAQQRGQRLNAIMDHARDIILATDADGVITEFNAAGIKSFGSDCVGRRLSSLFVAGTPLPASGAAEFNAVRGNGQVFPVELSIAPLHDPPSLAQVVIIRDISQRKMLERELNWLAHHDRATEMPNRLAFERALQEGLKVYDAGAVVVVLLHGHQRLVDLFGAAVGDALQRQIGQVLGPWLAEQQSAVARWNDGMLTLFLPRVQTESALQPVLRRLRRLLERSWKVDGYELTLRCRIGCVFTPEHGSEANTLVRRAALAASARTLGGVFTYALEDVAKEWNLLEAALNSALARGEIFLAYQPKICLHTAQLQGVEALMRWTHSELGPISPIKFIPIAEETGLIDELGAWAIQQAGVDARSWGSLVVAVNVSARQLGKPSLLEAVSKVIADGLEPGRIELEITESAMMNDIEASIEILQSLRNMGPSLAIDDFGTGYSSLAYLSRLPLSTLKIDQSFVRGLDNSTHSEQIIHTILSLAKTLNLKTVAEGIETSLHAGFLLAAGCQIGQGWYFSKPLLADQVTQRLQAELF